MKIIELLLRIFPDSLNISLVVLTHDSTILLMFSWRKKFTIQDRRINECNIMNKKTVGFTFIGRTKDVCLTHLPKYLNVIGVIVVYDTWAQVLKKSGCFKPYASTKIHRFFLWKYNTTIFNFHFFFLFVFH